MHERFPLMAQLELRHGSDVSVLPVSNISAGGVLVGVGQLELVRARPGDQVEVFLDPMDEGDDVSVRAVAEVVRVDSGREPGIALMWASNDPDVLARLSRLLAYLAAQDDER